MVIINGEPIPMAGKTPADCLALLSCAPQHVAIELNGVILPRAEYDTVLLRDGDRMEVVRFVGGG